MSLWVTNGSGGHLAHPSFLLSTPSSPITHLAPSPNFFFLLFFSVLFLPFVFFPLCTDHLLTHFSLFYFPFSPGFQHLTLLGLSICRLLTNLLLPLYSHFHLWLSKFHPPLYLASHSLSVAAFVSQSLYLSIFIPHCLSASCESVLVLLDLPWVA